MPTITDRLNRALIARNTNPNALAKKSGIAQSTIQRISDGTTVNPQQPILLALCRHLPCDFVWLQTGLGNMDNPHADKNHFSQTYSAGNIAAFRGLTEAPIIDWQEASVWNSSEIEESVRAEKATEWSQVVKLSERAYWLRVVGDLMVNPRETSYPDGTLICVDPAVTPRHNKFVLARDPLSGGAIFRKLTSDGSNWYLVPLNQQYATIPISDPLQSVIGVCVEYKPPGGAM